MTRPKSVLHVLNSAGGGACLSTLGIMDALRREGIAPAAVCHDAGTAAERAALVEMTDGRTIFAPLYWWNRKIRSKTWKRPLIELRQLAKTGWRRGSVTTVVDAARRWQADLIHTNNFLNTEGGEAAIELGLPHVWHLRELIGPRQPYRLPLDGPQLAKYLRRHASAVIANSHATARVAGDSLPAELLSIVPNGIDLSRFAPRSEPAARRPLVVGMVGSLTSRVKKHRLFIEAASRIPRDLSVQFRMYGHDPSQGGKVRGDDYVDGLHDAIAAAGMTERFAWPGFNSDPAQIMSELDILVHPADEESFGRVIVEAMAAGLPVVGVRGGGVNEIVLPGETGFLATPDDAGELAGHVERLLRDPELRQRLGRAGRQRAEQTYSLGGCAAGVLRAYETAMDRPLGRQKTTGTLAQTP